MVETFSKLKMFGLNFSIENIKYHIHLMMSRRHFVFHSTFDKDDEKMLFKSEKQIICVFVIPVEKVNNKKIIQIIHKLESSDWDGVIIVHENCLTSDARKTVKENAKFETFDFKDMCFDPIEATSDQPYFLYDGPPLAETHLLPKINDIITKYFGFKPGSIVYSPDFRTSIPYLFLVVKSS
jgi:hypothetical protein